MIIDFLHLVSFTQHNLLQARQLPPSSLCSHCLPSRGSSSSSLPCLYPFSLFCLPTASHPWWPPGAVQAPVHTQPQPQDLQTATRTEPGEMEVGPCLSPALSLGFQTRECCAGFFGPQCQPCPGRAENVCFGNGICLDGVNGTGVCECGEGFSGTACETCVEGKYGPHCDQGTHPPPSPTEPDLPTH